MTDSTKKAHPRTHNLKTNLVSFGEHVLGLKPWSLRFNDNDYRPGDVVVLREYDINLDKVEDADPYTGRTICARVLSVYHGQSVSTVQDPSKANPRHALLNDWVILGLDIPRVSSERSRVGSVEVAHDYERPPVRVVGELRL